MHDQNDADLREAIQFHGHLCPGLALGYRVAKTALRELGADRPEDEELIAVVENDSCAVDAIQFITGCTFGKGNLVFRDYGKHVYTFYNRRNGRGIRIAEDFRLFERDPRYSELKNRQDAGEDVSRELQELKMEKVASVLKAEDRSFLTITEVHTPPPAAAKVRASVRCSSCGERFMESRARVLNGKIVCLPCSGQQ